MSDPQSWAELTLKTDESAKKYSLSSAEIAVIGRSVDCQVALDPFQFITVSRRHAQIELVDATWQVKDLGTINGTFVNDMPIVSSKKLATGDRITLGSQGPEFVFECLGLDRPVVQSATSVEAELATIPTPESTLEDVRLKAASKLKSDPESLSAVPSAKPARTESKSPVHLPQVSASFDPAAKTLWNLVSTVERSQFPGHGAPILALAFSPDGQILASAAKDKTIKLWNTSTGTEIANLTGHDSEANALVFSLDSKTLASGGADKTIKLWQVDTQTETATIAAHKSAINALAFSPDSKILASGGADKTIKLWQVDTQTETATIAAHKSVIESLCFSPDSNILASGSKNKSIKLWDLASKKEIVSLSSHKQGIEAIAFSPDGNTLVSGSADKTIKLWGVATKVEIASFFTPHWQTGAIAFCADGQTIAGSDESGIIRLWQI